MKKIQALKTTLLKDRIHFLLLTLIFIVAVTLRFYNFPLRYGFDGDAIRDVIVTMLGAKNFEFPLAGNFSSVGPFTFGPFFRIQLILVTILFPFIYTPFIYMGFLSIIFVVLMYKIGNALGGKTTALVAALLAAISPDQITVATGISNPNVVPVFSSAAVYCFILLLKKDSKWLGFFLGIFLALGFDAHTQMLPLFILPLILIVYKLYKKMDWRMHTLFTILGGIIIFLPFIIFNFLSDWHTVRGMVYYYTEGKKKIYVPNRWLFYIRDFWPEMFHGLLGLPNIITALLVAFVSLTTVFLALKRKLSIGYSMLILVFMLNFILLRYYWGERHGVYLYYLQPIIFGIVSFSFGLLTKVRYGVYVLILGIVGISYFALQKDFTMFQPVSTGRPFFTLRDTINSQFPDSKVAIYNCNNFYNYRAEALSLMLFLSGDLNAAGKKIGFADQLHVCPYPRGNALPRQIATLSAEMIQEAYPPLPDNLIDFSKATDKEMRSTHWKRIDPEDLFDEEVNWWKKDYKAN